MATSLQDKAQALYNFWSSFGIPAYDTNAVPDEAVMPYITYDTATDSVGTDIPLNASAWYRDTSWASISQLADTVASKIGYSYYIASINGGYMIVKRNSVFAQRMSDPTDDSVRRILFSVLVEFLTDD